MYTRSEVIGILRKMQGKRTARDFAEELGISSPYLHDIYHGKTDPGPKVLAKIGMERHVMFVKVA